MATDYILFIHGVNTREERESPEYADLIFQKIQENIPNLKGNLKKVAFYWGNVNLEAETRLKKQLQASPLWQEIWFREFRENQLLQFAGDAALYISRLVGSKIAKKLKADALREIQNPAPDDRLHLVTHSWGTVILFDMLFAGRWDNPNIPGHEEVMSLRDAIFGIPGKDPNPSHGIKLASIHTMGSPIAIFSLTQVASEQESSTHDITPKLQEFLENIHVARGGKRLPWKNFVHLGDPIAYPLTELITSLVDNDKKYLDVQDVNTYEAGSFDFLTEPLNQTTFALLQGGKAHGSYWESEKVAQEISQVLKQSIT